MGGGGTQEKIEINVMENNTTKYLSQKKYYRPSRECKPNNSDADDNSIRQAISKQQQVPFGVLSGMKKGRKKKKKFI